MKLGFEGDAQLSGDEIERYSAHLLLPELGTSSYNALLKTRVLVVGAGGLGCTCISFIAAQGCKNLGIIDGDTISLSNLARQVLHSTSDIGTSKVASAKQTCTQINPSVSVQAYDMFIDADNAADILSAYDIVCDCTDNLPTRILLSDWCCLLGKPLVSAGAVRWEGHVTVYNYNFTMNLSMPKGNCMHHKSGCYRCLSGYTSGSARTECTQSCSEAGVIGGIVGMLGCLQAIETIKIATNMKNGECQCRPFEGIRPIKHAIERVLAGRMFYYNALRGVSRVFTVASRKIDCILCGNDGIVKKVRDFDASLRKDFNLHSMRRDTCNYAKNLLAANNFGGLCENISSIPGISVTELFRKLYLPKGRVIAPQCLLLDVRTPQEVAMCRLPTSLANHATVFTPLYIPTENIVSMVELVRKEQGPNAKLPIYVLCRLGKRSSAVTKQLIQEFGIGNIFNVNGGLHAWRKDVDSSFPIY